MLHAVRVQEFRAQRYISRGRGFARSTKIVGWMSWWAELKCTKYRIALAMCPLNEKLGGRVIIQRPRKNDGEAGLHDVACAEIPPSFLPRACGRSFAPYPLWPSWVSGLSSHTFFVAVAARCPRHLCYARAFICGVYVHRRTAQAGSNDGAP